MKGTTRKKVSALIAALALCLGFGFAAAAPASAASYPVAGPFSTKAKCTQMQAAYDNGSRIVIACFWQNGGSIIQSGWYFAYEPGA